MILGVYGISNTGKTTLVEKLTGALVERDYRVGTIKHIHIENFSMDTEGKDTWRHSRAGAEIVVGHSKDETAIILNKNLALGEVVSLIEKVADTDIVIAEGLSDASSPKICIGGSVDIEERSNTVLRYEDNFDEVLNYAMEGIETQRVLRRLPGLDCGKCGFDTCIELAGSVRKKERSYTDCHYYSERMVVLRVNGHDIPMGKFARDIMAGAVFGMVSSLKGVEDCQRIEIEIDNSAGLE
jgi:molybdopterin-guanine dinucleotide biosynthesis protein B